MQIKNADLHVHILQALYPEDLFEMAKDVYQEINWNRFGFLDRYEDIYGKRLDPVAIFERATRTGSLQEIEEACVYRWNGKGNFQEFNIKSYFPMCVTGYYFDKDDHISVLRPIVERHKREGLSYVEYRMGFMFTNAKEWKDWHSRFARFFKQASTNDFTAKYIVRIGPSHYDVVKDLLRENPDLVDTIVGVDFSGREIAPLKLVDFYNQVREDRSKSPQSTVDVVVHIGEDYYDKSLESAIRWCHQSALFGAKRLAHCIALGLDPEVAVARQQNAHESESVAERIAQIKYDLQHQEGLESFGVAINADSLRSELQLLQLSEEEEQITRPYNAARIESVRKRQDYVLSDLCKLGTIIEVCPTSNLCIGGVPSIEVHPFKKLYDSGINLAICTDDPGIFNCSISDEVDFVIRSFNLSEEELDLRLGDPYRFRLKADIGRCTTQQ